MTPHEMAATHAAAFRQTRAWSEQEFEDLIANRFTYVVGDARSFAVFQVIADQAELLTIATHPVNQRQGLARNLMKEWHAKAIELGAISAFLDVAADNDSARALYEASGYSSCGIRKDYYLRENSPNLDAIVMECRLERPSE